MMFKFLLLQNLIFNSDAKYFNRYNEILKMN